MALPLILQNATRASPDSDPRSRDKVRRGALCYRVRAVLLELGELDAEQFDLDSWVVGFDRREQGIEIAFV